jgi:hypothetical protein
MSLVNFHDEMLIHILSHTRTMSDVLSMALTSKSMFIRLSFCLPTAMPYRTREYERTALCLRRILTVIVGSQYTQKLNLMRQPSIPDEFFSVKYCKLLGESRMTHFIRNYYQLIPSEIGIRPQAVEAQLSQAEPELMCSLLETPVPVLSALLQTQETDDFDLRLALARQISVLIEYRSSNNAPQFLQGLRRQAAELENSVMQEMHRIEGRGMVNQAMEVCFTTEDRPDHKLEIEHRSAITIVNDQFLQMRLSKPGEKEDRPVTFAFDPRHNRWKSAHVITRQMNSFLPEAHLIAAFQAVSS